MAPVLVIFSGLSGTGKSAASRALALQLRAVWLRIDSLEEALRSCSLRMTRIDDAGYAAAQAAARDNLALGLPVVADMVNPWELTREAWRDVARAAGTPFLDVEMVCSDPALHRARVEARRAAHRGDGTPPPSLPPDWAAVMARDWRPHAHPVLTLDSAAATPEEIAARICAALEGRDAG